MKRNFVILMFIGLLLHMGMQIAFANNVPVAEIVTDGTIDLVPLLDAPDGCSLTDCVSGMRVAILDDIGNDWCHVQFGDMQGYLPAKNLKKTGMDTVNDHHQLPIIGYGAYLYDQAMHGGNRFIDIDGFLNTTRFPIIESLTSESYAVTVVSETPISIISLTSDIAQIADPPIEGFGPREYLHTFLFEDLFHEHSLTFAAGLYHVGKDMDSGLYTFEVTSGASLKITPVNAAEPILYEIDGEAEYTVYLPEDATVIFDDGILTSNTIDSIPIPEDNDKIFGTMRLLGGQQIILNLEDAYSITPMDGYKEGYYRYSTFLTDAGSVEQKEMNTLVEGEEKQLLIRPGEFIEFVDCKLVKMISNG